MTKKRNATQALNDRIAITDVIHRYAQAADAGDFDTVIACFAPTARLESANGVLEGIEAITAAMSVEGRRKARAASSGLQFEKSTHQMSNTIVTLDGEQAHAESSATAFLIGPKDGREVLVVRGLTYTDDFILFDNRWLICKRVHKAIWQFGPVPLAGP